MVTLGALAAYVFGIGCVTKGSGDPSLTDGSGATGLGLLTIGIMTLALATVALPGRPFARGCLLVPVVAGSMLVVLDDSQPLWFRLLAPVLGVIVAVLLFLTPAARGWFGDDDTPIPLSVEPE